MLRSINEVQKRFDRCLAEIDGTSKLEGNNVGKIKFKRGGGVDIVVSKRVA